jgi:hypothetical protein
MEIMKSRTLENLWHAMLYIIAFVSTNHSPWTCWRVHVCYSLCQDPTQVDYYVLMVTTDGSAVDQVDVICDRYSCRDDAAWLHSELKDRRGCDDVNLKELPDAGDMEFTNMHKEGVDLHTLNMEFV